jgi:exonuclease SbcC
MKFIHVADIHASRERLPQTLHILETLRLRAREGDIDFILFAGDFWDSTITATKGSGFSDIIAAVRDLEKYTQLIFIYGTPSHEPSGSLDAFKSDRTQICSFMDTTESVGLQTEIICIPEPRRSDYIAESAEKTTQLINKVIKSFIEKHREFRSDLFENRIVVYHGEVKGAVYQNGVSASSPTAISKEQLQSLNANYYALGHIHLPQEVFPNAWYPGSACPKNYGEPHDGCYNLVEIKDGETKVDRVSFGLPTFTTFYERPDNFIEGNKDSLKNMNIRFVFDCTKEERKQMNIKAYTDETKAKLNCLSVKIEPNIIEEDVVPISEVSKRKSIVEKMTEYVKEKDLKMPKHAKELLQEIQDSTLKALAYPQHSFELLSLSLRGAIGIRDGQHKEDFELNFEQYEDGVVCLVGQTGKGKSTLLENCHPYPCMLTRDGTLKEQFYLKDSHRILLYKDENGLYYRITMQINGKTATGKTSYFVDTSKDRETWKPVLDVDGSKETYEKWVEQTFGSIDVFLRTAFFAKEQSKYAEDISDTTKSQRMELLSKLAGTEHLKEVSVIAKEKRKEIEKSVAEIETELGTFSEYEETIQENLESIEFCNETIKEHKKLQEQAEAKISELKQKNAEYQKIKAVKEANATLYDQYQKEFDEKKERYECYEDALENYDIVEEYKESSVIIKSNVSKIAEKQKEIAEKQKEISKLTEELSALDKEFSTKEAKYKQLETEIKYVQSQIVPIEENCPTCGAKLSDSKIKELTSAVKENEKKIAELKKEQSKYVVEEESKQWQLVPIKSEIDNLKKDIEFLDEALSSLTNERDKAESFINENEEYADYVDFTEDELTENRDKLSAELDELQLKMDDIVDSETIEDVSDELEKAEAKLQSIKEYIAERIADIKSAEKENEKCQKKLDSVAGQKKKLKELQEKINAYNFIEDAFSNNGIPAIELRESAPEIANIANKILADSYGNKFEIRFGSTSELKAKRKVNEDFNILVYDSDNDDEKTIDLVSSGERIWIKQALFYAFSIVQMNRTGFNFRTRLIDESDGSLDGGLRPKYLKMVTAAHKIALSRITMLITHSQEIKDIAQQIIEI